jgi:ligand-binding sensor domain-containing protein/two-component sensor histidine kinase
MIRNLGATLCGLNAARFGGLVLLLCSLPRAASALNPHKALTQYTRTAWTQAEGLPQDSVRVMTQTSDGYLWLGTSEGLARFDGYEFVLFTKENGSLPDNSVTALCGNCGGSLWIGTASGLARYSGGRFQTFTSSNGLPPGTVTSLADGGAGLLWIVSGGVLSAFQNGKISPWATKDLAPLRSVRVVYQDSARHIWVGGVGALLERMGGRFVPVLGAKALGGNIITTILRDHAGLWLAGMNGIILLQSDGSLRRFGVREGLPHPNVRALYRDRAGNLWVGSDGGLSRLEDGRFVSASLDSKEDHDWVWSLFEDREGDLWVGRNNGLNRLRDDPFIIYGRPEGLPSNEPIVVHQDRLGRMWVGYRDSGLLQFGPRKGRLYTVQNGLPSNEIISIRDAVNGDLLISTRGGLSRMHGDRFFNYSVPDPAGRTVVFDTVEDAQRHLWAAAASGVYHFDGQNWRSMIPGGADPANYIVALAQTPDGHVWAGTLTSGLWLIGPEGSPKPRLYTAADGLGSNQIRSLYQDPDGTLWIGTVGGGLTMFRDGVFHHYGMREGLLSDNISHIEDDGTGTLWLSTTRGICRIPKQQFRDLNAGKIRVLTPRNYGIADGLRSAQCAPAFPASGGGTLTSDGQLWFPTGRGLARFDLHAQTHAPTTNDGIPIVHIIEVAVGGHVVDSHRAVRLKPGTGWIQFRFAGLYLSAPELVRYAYKLEGLDQDWVFGDTRRVVNYNPLPHGSYRFVVRALMPGGGMSERQFAFEVLPHFYETRTFFAICGICLFVALWGMYQLHLKQIHARFALVLEERTRLSREIHDTLAQGFVGISSQLDALAMKWDGDPTVARQHLDLARKMARHSLTEARRSVTDLRTPELEERDLARALTAFAHRWVAGTSVTVDVQTEEVKLPLPQDLQDNLLRIAQEAVANTLKHAKASKIWVDLQVIGRMVCLRIEDNGLGFEPAGALSMLGGHYGILGMRERAAKLGGEFDLASRPGSGTVVEVKVPLAAKSTRIN